MTKTSLLRSSHYGLRTRKETPGNRVWTLPRTFHSSTKLDRGNNDSINIDKYAKIRSC